MATSSHNHDLRQSVTIEDFLPHSPVADHTAAFVAACALGAHVYATGKGYKLKGKIPLASGTTLEFTNNPTITMDVSGQEGWGFSFGEGVTGADIRGSASILAQATELGSDGTSNCVFRFGGQYYTATAPKINANNRIDGDFNIHCIGKLNIKPVAIVGYSEDIMVKGVQASGQSNYAFFAHWCGNGTPDERPNLTWHPHRLTFERCTAIDTAQGAMLRGFTVSGAGQANFKNCHTVDVNQLGFNVFVGDYGYTYAQNIHPEHAMNIYLQDCSTQGRATALSVDGISSGVHNSPTWVGCDHQATITLEHFQALMKPGANTLGIAVAGIAQLTAKKLELTEQVAGNRRQAMYLTSVGSAELTGQIRADGGVLLRDCGHVEYNVHTQRLAGTHDTPSYCLSAAAFSKETKTVEEVAIGATTLKLDSVDLVTGPGGLLRYHDGQQGWEIEIRSMTKGGNQQTIITTPCPTPIPVGSTITIIQTVKSLHIGDIELAGARTLLRLTGQELARPRQVTLNGTRFRRSGIADVEASAVQSLVLAGTSHDEAGQSSLTTNTTCVRLGMYAEDFKISNCQFGPNNQHVRHLIYCNDSSRDGLISGNHFASVSSDSNQAAAVFLRSAKNVILQNNTTAPKVRLKYPD